jgi:hypothetical protein
MDGEAQVRRTLALVVALMLRRAGKDMLASQNIRL